MSINAKNLVGKDNSVGLYWWIFSVFRRSGSQRLAAHDVLRMAMVHAISGFVCLGLARAADLAVGNLSQPPFQLFFLRLSGF